MKKENIEKAREQLSHGSAQEALRWCGENFPGDRVAVSTSFGVEDQVITDLAQKAGAKFRYFTLDTGRLFPETYATMEKTRERYGLKIQTFSPDTGAVERMVTERGPNLFYESVENRKLCCGIRKVEPLRRALAGADIWVVGNRREQSFTREGTEVLSWDEEHGLLKLSPLWNWTFDQVWAYARDHKVPTNPLHDQGFPSIGCAPCTRAIAPGEDIRAGRWWWEHPDQKECGLHPVREKSPSKI